MTNTLTIRFQDRDARILGAIQDYGGILAKHQVHSIFWRGKSQRAMQNRLAKLKANAYIDWPSSAQRKCNPVPEPIIWLGWKGILYLANAVNLKVEDQKSITETQLRSLERSLRA